ncbi:MAG: RHS repeat domain-containing protein, partial [Saezia sp.]
QVTSYVYDAVGQLTQKQDATGHKTRFEYNAVGLMVKETLTAPRQSEAEQTVKYTYDKNGTLLEVTKVSSRNGDINTHHKFTRDELGLIVREDITYGNSANAITKNLRYGYDADGRKVSITYPDGSVQTASYEHGQLKTMTRPDGKTVSWSAYEWLRAKQLDTPSVKQTLSFDALQRTAGIEAKSTSNQPLLERTYLYDKAGNIITRNTEEGEYSYGYDQLSRLKQVNPPQSAQQKGLPQESYAYDAVHNRVGSSHQAGAWEYNQDNQLVKFGAGSDETIYTYTANGHVATETRGGTTRTYEYDAADRLIRVTNTIAGTETEIARYAYDPFGRRISKTVNGETIYFIYTSEGIVAELNEGGDITRAYGWELNSMYGTKPLWQAEVANNSLSIARFHTLITDHLGTPQMAVNDAGNITWKAVSESFGETIPNQDNQITMNLRFPGQYFDEETNSHYNYFRDYSPSTGRYLQKDPIGLAAGINWYNYVLDNPMKYSDFFGFTAACPNKPPENDSNWKPYKGKIFMGVDTGRWAFHCGYRGWLENRDPTAEDPQGECFYDTCGRLVDMNHPYAGCRGTPNQYSGDTHPSEHTWDDSGGIWHSGWTAFWESRKHDLFGDYHYENQSQQPIERYQD